MLEKCGISLSRPVFPCAPCLFSFPNWKMRRVPDCCLCAFTVSVNCTKGDEQEHKKARRCSSLPLAVAVTHSWGMRLQRCGCDKVPLGKIKPSIPGQPRWFCVCDGRTSSGRLCAEFRVLFGGKAAETKHWKFLIKLCETASTVAIKGNMGTIFLTFLIYLFKKRKY